MTSSRENGGYGKKIISVSDSVAFFPDMSNEYQGFGWAAPLPDEKLSLGYPATNSPRGKAQAGDSLASTHAVDKWVGYFGGWGVLIRRSFTKDETRPCSSVLTNFEIQYSTL